MAKKGRLEATELKAHIGYRLRIVSNAVSHAFARKLAASDVTLAEWVILREMYAGEDRTTPSLIAELTGLTRGAVSKLIDRLVNKKLVERSAALEDRRYQNIKLTPQGIRIVPKLASIADENDQSYFSVLTESERKNLMKTLVKLAERHQLKTSPTE